MPVNAFRGMNPRLVGASKNVETANCLLKIVTMGIASMAMGVQPIVKLKRSIDVKMDQLLLPPYANMSGTTLLFLSLWSIEWIL